MQKFEAPTLEEAYAKAAETFSCSITELEIQVIQNPSKGFLGFGRKPAIIVAQPLQRSVDEPKEQELSKSQTTPPPIEAEHPPPLKDETPPQDRVEEVAENDEPQSPSMITTDSTSQTSSQPTPSPREDQIFDNFYTETPDIESVALHVEEEMNRLFASACFELDPIQVSVYDKETLFIEFNGPDAALLIGKEGYRYKALAYLLFNWIHSKYGFKVRLEIAKFLENQEMMIENYLQPIIERVHEEGRAQTKVLDGILVQIALKRLREIFPNKYVAIRTNREGGRYIIINEFLERR
ncbi:MAG: protein jag [Hydrogenimonas sp.]|nr:MAG: protein jag [Hydrogenimonas sp.]